MQRDSRHSPEAKEKMSTAHKASWTPEKRQAASLRNSERLLRLWKTREFREKQHQLKTRAAERRRGKVSGGVEEATSCKTDLI
jgi:hypothetical protein